MYINIRHNKYLAVLLCPCVMLHVAHYSTSWEGWGHMCLTPLGHLG